MKSRLLNVRLDEDRLRKVRRLRETGVMLSAVVRQAIDNRFEMLSRSLSGREAAAAVIRIHDAHPDPIDLPERTYDVHDRRAARTAIARALKRRTR